MEGKFTLNAITPDDFNNILDQYPSIVPDKLAELDKQRYDIIPTRIKADAEDAPSLSKRDVATLVDWKLSHGKFRPTLKGLVQQNDEEIVAITTRDAFKAYTGGPKEAQNANIALTALSKLRGIGPATASLLLSVYDPDNAPFFSDELFRWCMLDDRQGWDRAIKYNAKEYLGLHERVAQLKKRFLQDFNRDVSAVDVEKVAYVLGKQHSGEGSGGKAGGGGAKRKSASTTNGRKTKAKRTAEPALQPKADNITTKELSPSTEVASSKPTTRRSSRRR